MQLRPFIYQITDSDNQIDFKMMKKNRYLFLYDDDSYSQPERAVVEAISLDIRGDYNWFLKNNKTESNESLVWTGDLYEIEVCNTHKIVYLRYLETNNEKLINEAFSVSLEEWNDALSKWRKMYLKTLGFLEFNSEELNHFFGVLILAQDSLYDELDIILDNSIVSNSIRKCADRYGINSKIVFQDCRRVTGLHNINDVYSWIADFVSGNENKYDIFVKEHISSYNEDFTSSVKAYLDLNW